jgi:hypothetical protein
LTPHSGGSAMPKIPLTKTIEDAYGFTFRNILSVFGVG